MNINPINNQQNNTVFQKGLYFTKHPTVLFNNNAKFDGIIKDTISTSKEGFRYIENKNISNKIQENITNNPFIKDLAEKFDTFVYIRNPFKCPDFNNFCSHIKIKWFDSSKNIVETRDVVGISKDSKKLAQASMLDKLNINEFF